MCVCVFVCVCVCVLCLYVCVTRNPNKCTHYLRAISTIVEIISIIKRVTSHFSSELSSGRRPESKSDEKCEVTLLIIEI